MAKTSLANRVPAAMLSSPLHPLPSSKRLVLTFTGHRVQLPPEDAIPP